MRREHPQIGPHILFLLPVQASLSPDPFHSCRHRQRALWTLLPRTRLTPPCASQVVHTPLCPRRLFTPRLSLRRNRTLFSPSRCRDVAVHTGMGWPRTTRRRARRTLPPCLPAARLASLLSAQSSSSHTLARAERRVGMGGSGGGEVAVGTRTHSTHPSPRSTRTNRPKPSNVSRVISIFPSPAPRYSPGAVRPLPA
jgi:hypothetical protein